MTLNPKIECFSGFLQLSAASHISKVNCAKVAEDRAGQPAYKIFSIERTFLTIWVPTSYM